MRYIVAALAAGLVSSPAAAVDFNFQFEGTSGSFSSPGTVTGTIFGLADDGTSAATSIFVKTPTESVVLSGSNASISSNAFTVSNGDIVGFKYEAYADILNNVLFHLALNIGATRTTTLARALDIDTFDENLYVASSGRAVTFTRIEAPAVPEPATWAMMLVGFGFIAGATRYRRKSVKASFA
jgi:hypothetical protein